MALDNILLIDDNDIDNLVNKKVLEKSGLAGQITVKMSALSAIEYLKNLDVNNLDQIPDIIFLDIRMPEVDGFGFLDLFSSLNSTIRAKTRIVMLSSSIDSDDFHRAMSCPFVIKFINKPLTKQAVSDVAELL
jgi:CheY-like chemotaxis protein